jgi:hypothetical protein
MTDGPPILQAGMIAWAHTWPDWEHLPGQEEPHPVIGLGCNQAGELALLPCSSKGDLGRLQVSLCRTSFVECPSAFKPLGPLSKDPTWACVADKHWRPNLRWAQSERGLLVMPQTSIRLRRITKLAESDWKRLQFELAKAIRTTKDQRR